MNNRDAALRRYCRQVKSWLPCSRKQKKRIMAEIHESIEAYLEQNPQADFAQLQTHFGTPKAIASAYVDNLDTGTLLHGLRIRHRVMAVVSCTAVALLLLWATGVAAIVAIQANQYPAYIEVEIEDETVDLSDDSDVVRYYP